MMYINFLLLINYLTLGVVGQCEKIVTRQEIRSLSRAKRNAYLKAAKRLHETNNIATQISRIHYGNIGQAHGVPGFFPWHRYFIREYEKRLQEFDPNVVLPYWDWTLDSQAPEKSPIFSNDFMGGNGRRSDNCVTAGVFANLRVSVPNRHCLRRQFNNGNEITAFYSSESLEAIISQANVYDTLRKNIEGGPHGAVHNGIGGDRGDMRFMYSSNDPIFFLHHAFVDLLWSEWQTRKPNLANTYNGGSARLSDIMRPFNVRVQSAMNTTNLCYNYPRFDELLPQNISPVTANKDFFGFKKVKERFNRFTSMLRSVTPSTNQLMSPGQLRIPQPLPESFIKMNHLDVDEVRTLEANVANLTTTLNHLDELESNEELQTPIQP